MIDDIKRPKPSLKEVLPKSSREVSRPARRDYHLVSTPAPRRRSRLLFWLVVIVVLGLAAFFSLTSFSKATVVITPKQSSFVLNENLSAQLKPTTETDLAFQTMVIEETASKMVKATGTAKVEKRATGRIVIYNRHSAASQKLIANTRFESPQGSIFRIASSVVVPGYTKTGGVITPGSLEVTVTADRPGAEENLGVVDWTIPGFKGEPRYQGFYAKSKTPMTGGLVAEAKVIEPGLESATRAELKEAIKTKLLARAAAEVPSDFILYPEASLLRFIPEEPALNSPDISNDLAEVKERASLTAIIFNRAELENFLIRSKLPDLETSYEIANLADLKFALDPKVLTATDFTTEELSFSLNGEAKLVATIDKMALVKLLLKLPRGEFKKVVGDLPAIQEASATLQPSWAKHFPASADKIIIETVLK